MRWEVSYDFGSTFHAYSSLAAVSPILAEFGIIADFYISIHLVYYIDGVRENTMSDHGHLAIGLCLYFQCDEFQFDL